MFRFIFASLCWLAVGGIAHAQSSNPFESNIRAFEQEDARNPPPTNSILFLGSSTIVGWNTLSAAFPRYHVLNRGFGGSQASDVLYFYDRVVTPYRSPLVVFYEGDNDLAGGKTVDQVFSDWTNFVARIHRDLPDSDVMFVSVKPSPSRANLLPKVRELNERIRQFNAADPKLLYADVFTAMLGSNGQPRPELFVSDNLHLNPTGYAVWESVLVPAVERWAETYPIEVRKSETNTLLIDFGAPEFASGREGGGATHWNNVSASVGSANTGALPNLVKINGDVSSAALRMISRFNGANENGSTSSEIYPTSATRDSLFGNTETFSGLANTTPKFQITGLNSAVAYRLTFYASRLSVNDNRETRYTATGADTQSADLNVANNVNATAVIASLFADASGVIDISLTPGPNNNNANHFTYLGVLRIDPLDGSAGFLFDFGSSGSPTETQDDLAGPVWNDVLTSVGTDDSGALTNLVAVDGFSTGIEFQMVSRFNGANLNGTTSATNFPASATQDSLFGNTESFNEMTNVLPSFKLTGLDASASYDLAFYASRVGVSDNRETRYSVTGAASAYTDLDAANNVEGVAVLNGVKADSTGALLVSLQPGPRNSNANHFTYLGVLRLEWSIAPFRPAILSTLAHESGTLTLELKGQPGVNYRLEKSSDLQTWTELRTINLEQTSTSIQLDTPGSAGFFRVVRR